MQDSTLEILDWGYLSYLEAYERQLAMVKQRINGSAPDRLILVEHPPVVTLGRSGSHMDLRISQEALRQRGVELYAVERGGLATFHGPGQLVAYTIIKLTKKDTHHYLQTLLGVVAAVLRNYGLTPEFKQGVPGVWVDSGKIASIGIAVKKWVAFHGLALNVNVDLEGFELIVPCGNRGERMTSLSACLGHSIDLAHLKKIFINEFLKSFAYTQKTSSLPTTNKRPHWLVRRATNLSAMRRMEGLLNQLQLATVCQSANCPNLGDCFSRGTATFMILGTRCSRACRFCAVDKGRPLKVDPDEPERIARAVELMKLNYVVITSVTRDDLADGGAGQFSQTIKQIRRRCGQAKMEVLIPDFGGSRVALKKVCNAHPDVLNHNIEMVERLYPVARPGADYRRSMEILEYAAKQHVLVKSGLMLGLGETQNEVKETLIHLKQAGCRYLSLGQYLAPSQHHLPVARFVPPEEFDQWAAFARQLGFTKVAAGPLVRSSYHADKMFNSSEGLMEFQKEFRNPNSRLGKKICFNSL